MYYLTVSTNNHLLPGLLTLTQISTAVPLYMTPKYRDQMMAIITKEINRVYQLFIQRNPDFLQRRGKVSIYGHSLGVSGYTSCHKMFHGLGR
jgi:hypothetical protein